ncbi:ent-kaurene oxidase [Colletotrichum tofieldiae]|nr:ent-kaurene oxidase [Colletotrichum tofieldiae]GKT79386.1 ent-kaurene oxidase [Colletotrichum tofieldiae]GKT82559.1 ent-kaurene oxidase [Colletotrichum tofieldiae]
MLHFVPDHTRQGPLDESKYPQPLRFDPHRFVRLRSGVDPDPIGYTSREQYQFISVTKENMAFGFGKSACPGRFFAANEMKLILICLLQDYDVKMPKGIKGRYQNIIREHRSRLTPPRPS